MRGELTVIAAAAMLILTSFAAVPVAATESVSVATNQPTDVTTDSATLHGNVTALEESEHVTVWFQYWKAGEPSTKIQTEKHEATGEVSFSVDVTGLKSGQEYVVVAKAETENASAVGNEVNFTTDEVENVAVETGEASGLSDTGATLNGDLTTLTGADNATVWFEYWAAGDPANNTSTTTQDLDTVGAFSATVPDLSNNTTYVFVAHAATENASDTGAEVTFTTFDRNAPLDVDTLAASEVTNTSATLNGQLPGMDGESEAEVWFEYWVEGDPANSSTTANQTLTAPGPFNASLAGLENQTTYVYVAHAEANGSTVEGGEVEFFTSDAGDGSGELVWDGEGPFGQWVTSWLKNLVPADGGNLGQRVADIVTANNPGSEHRSDNANAGPPEDKGKPDHAGPPEDKGKPDDVGAEGDDDDDDDDDDEGNGKGKGKDKGNNGQGNGN